MWPGVKLDVAGEGEGRCQGRGRRGEAPGLGKERGGVRGRGKEAETWWLGMWLGKKKVKFFFYFF
jgi:hypothetical protein